MAKYLCCDLHHVADGPEIDLLLLVLLERAYERESHMDPGLLSLLL
jgi:hypothetical protein